MDTLAEAGNHSSQALAGETMYCWHYEGAHGASTLNNVQYEHQFCIDPTVPSSYLQRFTDADGNELIIWNEGHIAYNWYYVHTWYNIPSDKEMYEVNPTNIWGMAVLRDQVIFRCLQFIAIKIQTLIIWEESLLPIAGTITLGLGWG